MNKQAWQLVVLSMLLNICSFYPAWAENNAPMVTRWMSPDNIVKPLHKPLDRGQYSITRKAMQLSHVSQGLPSAGRICLVVHHNIYDSITTALSQYEADLQSQGFNTVIYVYFSSESPEDLRANLATLYQEPASLVGAVLIGNIPYITYEMMQDWGDGGGAEYEAFPCDIFYMDLNGTWSDTLSTGSVQPNNGKYDTRGGNLSLEIWVSRLKTDNLLSLGTEVGILDSYFNKDHRYRTGLLVPAKKALVYDDDDWASMAVADSADLAKSYQAENVTTISDPNQTTATDYKTNRLTAAYEFIFVRSHGWSGGHGFYENNKAVFDYVYPSAYLSIDPEAVFYSLFVCSGADYTVNDNLAGTITFNPDDSGLLSIGSTKTGGMWYGNSFYTALANKATFGEAFQQWFNAAQSKYSSDAPQWWYGMVLIGDGALTTPQNNSSIIPAIKLLL